MEKTADWIMRRAGFGFNLTKDPITQKEWVASSRASLKEPKLYIKDHRFKELSEFVGSKLTEKDTRSQVGAVRGLSGAILNYSQVKKHEKKVRKVDVRAANKLWDKYSKNGPMWMAAHRRFDFAVNTNHDFLNRLWFFWLNFFTVGSSNRSLPFLPHHQETIRANMLGDMDELVYKVVTHPGMLLYLDNTSSTGMNSKARKKGWTKNGVNENLGRELLELFTVTPAFGYTQDDVNGVTNVLTGLRINSKKNTVHYAEDYHEPKSQKILGKTYAGSAKSGKSKLKRLVRDLCAYSSTGINVSFRLCQHFISDSPSQDHVRELSQIYDNENGNLSKVYIGLLDILDRLPHENSKFLNPEVWAYQCLKTLDLSTFNTISTDGSMKPSNIDSVLDEIGMLHGQAAQPNGFPETEAGWLSNEYLDRRLRFSTLFTSQTMLFDGYSSTYSKSVLRDGLNMAQLSRFNLANTTKDFILNDIEPRSVIPMLFCSPDFLRS